MTKKPQKTTKKRKLKGKKRLMYEQLIAQMGVVTAATKIVGVDRTTHYQWLKKDANYKAWCEEAPEIVLDFVENALLRSIKGDEEKGVKPNVSAQMFYLKTKGKKRGYVERQEIITDVIMRKTATPEEVAMYNEFYDEHGKARNKTDGNKA